MTKKETRRFNRLAREYDKWLRRAAKTQSRKTRRSRDHKRNPEAI